LTFVGPVDHSRSEYTIQVELVCTKADGSQETFTGSFTITIQAGNTPPTFTLTSPADGALYTIGETVTLIGDINDPDSDDTHTYHVNWDDGISDNNLYHRYGTAGVYTISTHVEDSNGGVSPIVQVMVVVYDPSAGFVTGGGWFDSPQGAYTPDPSLTGKANFGFVAKYKKGATTPDGQTEFVFQTAGLNFHSMSYEWLVVAGNKAMFKGVGTIDGQEYKFMLMAIDGDLKNGDGIDKFRIRIWSEDILGNESVIYDNQPDAMVDDDPVTELGGGSIVIHTK